LTASPAAVDAPRLVVDHVAKRFGGARGVQALDGVCLDVAAAEFFSLLGPSGCGKTTLLRILAGFERPDSGRVLIDGEDVTALPPHVRPVNLMFQRYALFPHLSVHDNIAYGLRRAGLPRAEVRSRVEELLALVQLEALAGRRPEQLSGGQQQRVALARAVARRPRLLLLDEPLAALDRRLRESTALELKRLQRELGITFVMVTHDQGEAMSLSSRIGVMFDGRLRQVGAPRALYRRPADREVAGFLGDVNLVDARVAARFDDGRVAVDAGGDALLVAAGEAPVGEAPVGEEALSFAPATGEVPAAEAAPVAAATAATALLPAGSAVTVGVRPECIALSVDHGESTRNVIEARVTGSVFLGDATVVQLVDARGRTWQARVAGGGQAWLADASRLFLSFAATDAFLLPA
jgi:putrescine transport system ATP-binding protein